MFEKSYITERLADAIYGASGVGYNPDNDISIWKAVLNRLRGVECHKNAVPSTSNFDQVVEQARSDENQALDDAFRSGGCVSRLCNLVASEFTAETPPTSFTAAMANAEEVPHTPTGFLQFPRKDLPDGAKSVQKDLRLKALREIISLIPGKYDQYEIGQLNEIIDKLLKRDHELRWAYSLGQFKIGDLLYALNEYLTPSCEGNSDRDTGGLGGITTGFKYLLNTSGFLLNTSGFILNIPATLLNLYPGPPQELTNFLLRPFKSWLGGPSLGTDESNRNSCYSLADYKLVKLISSPTNYLIKHLLHLIIEVALRSPYRQNIVSDKLSAAVLSLQKKTIKIDQSTNADYLLRLLRHVAEDAVVAEMREHYNTRNQLTRTDYFHARNRNANRINAITTLAFWVWRGIFGLFERAGLTYGWIQFATFLQRITSAYATQVALNLLITSKKLTEVTQSNAEGSCGINDPDFNPITAPAIPICKFSLWTMTFNESLLALYAMINGVAGDPDSYPKNEQNWIQSWRDWAMNPKHLESWGAKDLSAPGFLGAIINQIGSNAFQVFQVYRAWSLWQTANNKSPNSVDPADIRANLAAFFTDELGIAVDSKLFEKMIPSTRIDRANEGVGLLASYILNLYGAIGLELVHLLRKFGADHALFSEATEEYPEGLLAFNLFWVSVNATANLVASGPKTPNIIGKKVNTGAYVESRAPSTVGYNSSLEETARNLQKRKKGLKRLNDEIDQINRDEKKTEDRLQELQSNSETALSVSSAVEINTQNQKLETLRRRKKSALNEVLKLVPKDTRPEPSTTVETTQPRAGSST